MSPDGVDDIAIVWHDGPRTPLWPLFELADDSSEQIDGYLDLGRLLVARDSRGLTYGHAQLVPTNAADTVELKSVAVHEAHQRRGIGRRLVERAIAVCRDEGTACITVTTATADIDKVRFYQRCGFRPTSIERDAFTPEKGYPSQLEANGIPVRDSITLTLDLD